MSSEVGITVNWREPEAGCTGTLVPSPFENQGFVETGTYLFQQPASGWDFRIDDEPLAASGDSTACWAWSPGFFAGEVTAELIGPGGRTAALFLLDVSPDLSKTGRETFARLLDELWAADPSLVLGSEPATNPIGELGATDDPWLAFARLRRHGPDFLRALALVAAHPRRELRVKRDLVSIQQVRRVDQQTARSAARAGYLAALSGKARARHADVGLVRLDVPRIEETLDSAANRALLSLARAVSRRAGTLLAVLHERTMTEEKSETRTSLKARWPARQTFLVQFSRRLTILLRGLPFSAVRRVEATAAGLTAVSADPLYARAWGRGWRALRHGVDSNATDERLWMSPTWEIYERWCFVRLGKQLVEMLPGWKWHRVSHRPELRGSQGDLGASLRLQPLFPAERPTASGRWSVSMQREPDIVLTASRGSHTEFVVLDAKYRTARPNVLDAMSSAHIYQDSLRIHAQRPTASLLLVPRGGGAAWLESPDFQGQHRVGVQAFSPDRPNDLPVPVRQWLEDFVNQIGERRT